MSSTIPGGYYRDADGNGYHDANGNAIELPEVVEEEVAESTVTVAAPVAVVEQIEPPTVTQPFVAKTAAKQPPARK